MSVDYHLLDVQQSELRATINTLKDVQPPDRDDARIGALEDLDALVTYLLVEEDAANLNAARLTHVDVVGSASYGAHIANSKSETD